MVTAITGGTITAIAVQPGQHVEPGQVLLSLNDMQEKLSWNVCTRNGISNKSTGSKIHTIREHSSNLRLCAPRWTRPKNGSQSVPCSPPALGSYATCAYVHSSL
jgi:multidrug resistance efflux pump